MNNDAKQLKEQTNYQKVKNKVKNYHKRDKFKRKDKDKNRKTIIITPRNTNKWITTPKQLKEHKLGKEVKNNAKNDHEDERLER